DSLVYGSPSCYNLALYCLDRNGVPCNTAKESPLIVGGTDPTTKHSLVDDSSARWLRMQSILDIPSGQYRVIYLEITAPRIAGRYHFQIRGYAEPKRCAAGQTFVDGPLVVTKDFTLDVANAIATNHEPRTVEFRN
ncbi:MAG: hypothetical protein Q7K40_02045, partial [bacterium]|nr:hypothetical protein [bacterium]